MVNVVTIRKPNSDSIPPPIEFYIEENDNTLSLSKRESDGGLVVNSRGRGKLVGSNSYVFISSKIPKDIPSLEPKGFDGPLKGVLQWNNRFIPLPQILLRTFTINNGDINAYYYPPGNNSNLIQYKLTGNFSKSILNLSDVYPDMHTKSMQLYTVRNNVYLGGNGGLIRIINNSNNIESNLNFFDDDFSEVIPLDDNLLVAHRPSCMFYLCKAKLVTYSTLQKTLTDSLEIPFRLSGYSYKKGDGLFLLVAAAMPSEYDQVVLLIQDDGSIIELDEPRIAGVYAYNRLLKKFLVSLYDSTKDKAIFAFLSVEMMNRHQ
ncbi:hypothetical protein [Thalassotalea sediminis]|uniref:hypothetical protein n=1 Tax=Thalassotalea sediminis TaxID=1759089 RepID=UPI002572B186|nr:hypothetical protein [Thalassotalea sediminis]